MTVIESDKESERVIYREKDGERERERGKQRDRRERESG